MKHYLYIIMCLFLLVSCEKEIGEFTDYESPRLVVNALITAGGEDQELRIHKTGVTLVEPVTGADVSLCVNGNEIYSTTTNGESSLIIHNNPIKPGDIVTIKAKKDDMLASATAEVPQPVIITGIDTVSVNVKRYSWSDNLHPHTRYLVHLRLPGNIEQKVTQYFRVEIVKDLRTVGGMSNIDKDGNIVDQYFIDFFNTDTDHSYFNYSYDPALCENENIDQENMSVDFDWLDGVDNRYHVFRSEYFDNGEYTLRLDLPHPGSYSLGWEQDVRIRVYSISKFEYLYLQALATAQYYEMDIISNSEPMIPSNVDGGAGIFCIESVAEISFFEDHEIYQRR